MKSLPNILVFFALLHEMMSSGITYLLQPNSFVITGQIKLETSRNLLGLINL